MPAGSSPPENGSSSSMIGASVTSAEQRATFFFCPADRLPDRAVTLPRKIEELQKQVDVLHKPFFIDAHIAGPRPAGNRGRFGLAEARIDREEKPSSCGSRALPLPTPCASCRRSSPCPAGATAHRPSPPAGSILPMPFGPRITTTSPRSMRQVDPAEHGPHTIMLRDVVEFDHGLFFGNRRVSVSSIDRASAKTSFHHTMRFWGCAIQCPSSGN